MKQIIFLIIFSLLTACVHRPVILPQVRCFNQYKFNYGTEEDIKDFFESIEEYKNNELAQQEFLNDVLSIFGKARCNLYDLNNAEAVDPNGGYDLPLADIDLNGGFSFKSWAVEIRPWAKESIKYYEDVCSNGRRAKREQKLFEAALLKAKKEAFEEGNSLLNMSFESHMTDLY